jgi:hypothetical protein
MVMYGTEVQHTHGEVVLHGGVVQILPVHTLQCGVVVGLQVVQTEKLDYLNIKDI